MLLTTAKKQALPLGKLGLWLGVYALTKHLTGNDTLAAVASQAGLTVNTDAICEVLAGVIPNKITDSYNEVQGAAAYGLNHNLDGAFEQAIEAALDELSGAFKPGEPLSDFERQQVTLFFRSLGYQLKQADFNPEQVRLYVADRPRFFDQLWQDYAANAAEPAVSDAVLADLTAFAVTRFDERFRHYLNEELKADDKAKTAYFIELMEWAAQTNAQNAETLHLLSAGLDQIAINQQQQTDLLRRVARAQEQLHEYLRKVAADFRQFVRENQAFRDRLDAQLEPSLTLPVLKPRAGHEFDYRYQYTAFIGREAELNTLWTFVAGQPDRRFTWWLVTGPGGMGKSRLALELCRQARYLRRHVGFVNRSDLQDFNWAKWRPQHASLLVVDYVAADAEAVRRMLADLSRSDQNEHLRVPVRVLLLEREASANDDWWTNWLNDGDLAASSHHPDEPERLLTLPAFTPADHWRIIADIHRQRGKPLRASETETLTKLAELDPEGRPLFACFVGMALAEDNDIGRWNVSDLLANHLGREKERIWKKHPRFADLGEGHQNLLLLATLTRGLTEADLTRLYADALPGLPVELDNELYERMAHIAELPFGEGANAATWRLFEGLQPDLVGEFFVLQRLKVLQKQIPNGPITANALLQAAWTADAGQTWWMIWQTIRDYPDQSDARLRATKPKPDAPASHWQEWAKLAVNLTDYYGTDKQFDQAELTYADLRGLVAAFPHDAAIALEQAKGAYNLTHDYGTDKQFDQAELKYADLRGLVAAFPHDAAIALQQAMGAYNLTTDYGTDKQFDQAELTYADLRGLVAAFPQDAAIALQQAMGAYNLTLYYGTDKQFDQAELKYADLRGLVAAFPHDAAIALQQAKGAVNLTNDYGTDKQFDQAELKYADLRGLVAAFPHDAAIALPQAMGAVNLTNDYGTDKQFDQAELKYADLRGLVAAFPHDAAIALRQAMGAGALLYFSRETPQLVNRQRLVDELGALLAQYEQHTAWQEKLPLLAGTLQDELGRDDAG